jgi:streptomycin 6-kinase
MTERLGLDQDRAVAWTLGRVLQDAVWDLTLLGETRVRREHRTIAEALVRQRGRPHPSRSAPAR